jgi:hypothetical protein
MKNYQYLDISNHKVISNQIYNFLITNYNIEKFIFWNPIDFKKLLTSVIDLHHALDTLKLSVKSIAIIKTKGNGNIHVDYNDINLGGPRLLWPIKNCVGSETRFFDVKSEWLETVFLKNNIAFNKINNSLPLNQIDKFELNRPVIFNPQVAHGIYCNPIYTEDRISMTISTNESLISYLTL